MRGPAGVDAGRASARRRGRIGVIAIPIANVLHSIGGRNLTAGDLLVAHQRPDQGWHRAAL